MKGQKRPSSFNLKERYIMRWLLSLIFIIVTLSSTAATETKTEYLTEEVCHAVAGCWVDTKTGECPDCVMETRKIVTEVKDSEYRKDESVESVKPLVVTKTSSKMCYFPKLGHERDCDWKDRGRKTAAAVKRGTKECGGFMNWEWTDVHHSEYICKG